MNKRFGVMLDMSRDAVMKPEQVKAFAKLIRSFGYNMIQLYTEDTYEVPGEPYFGYMRGRYTQAELKDIVNYCEEIGMEVIPCIQTLAHVNQIFKWAPYQSIRDVNDILLAEEDRTYELIENMFKSLRACFKSRYVHIGADEAHMLGLGKYLDKHGFANRFDILKKHLEKVIVIAEKYGFKPIMWSDMFFRLANHDAYYAAPEIITPEITASCPENVGLVYWDYYHDQKTDYDNMILAHQKFPNELWFAGGVWSWAGMAARNGWSIQSMKPAMASCAQHGVENILMTMWGDNGKETSFYALLPALFAVRRFYDGQTDMEQIKAEFAEKTGEDFDAMMLLDLPHMVREDCDNSAGAGKYMLYNDPFCGFFDSVVQGGESARCAKLAEKIRLAGKESAYGYLFDSAAAFCDLLSVKYELGAKTRTAYQKKDMPALERLVGEYALAEEKLEKFYRAFEALWMRENKPNGFEVHQLRLGGLMLRLRSCRERLAAYAGGQLAEIPELDEQLLDFLGGGEVFSDKLPGFHNWRENATVHAL